MKCSGSPGTKKWRAETVGTGGRGTVAGGSPKTLVGLPRLWGRAATTPHAAAAFARRNDLEPAAAASVLGPWLTLLQPPHGCPPPRSWGSCLARAKERRRGAPRLRPPLLASRFPSVPGGAGTGGASAVAGPSSSAHRGGAGPESLKLSGTPSVACELCWPRLGHWTSVAQFLSLKTGVKCAPPERLGVQWSRAAAVTPCRARGCAGHAAGPSRPRHQGLRRRAGDPDGSAG